MRPLRRCDRSRHLGEVDAAQPARIPRVFSAAWLDASWPPGGAAPAESPPAPWCAVRLEPTLALDPAAAAWLGDAERCLAWCWWERGRHRPDVRLMRGRTRRR